MLGILTGLKFEADIARAVLGKGAMITCAAAVPATSRKLARSMIAAGATRLLSFGCAGGLEHGLGPGRLILADEIVISTTRFKADQDWHKELRDSLPTAEIGPMWGSETVIGTVAAKKALYHKTGCLAVDMESHCLAEIAAEAKVPYAIIRVIADDVETLLPSAVMVPFKADGSADHLRIVMNLLRRPQEVPAVLRLGQHMRQSAHALRTALGQVRDRL
jgi:adenosylhomocysteine nucleosidase